MFGSRVRSISTNSLLGEKRPLISGEKVVQNKTCTQVKDDHKHKAASQATFNYFSGHAIFTGLDWTTLWLLHRVGLGKLALGMDLTRRVYTADYSKKVSTGGRQQMLLACMLTCSSKKP